MGLCISRPVTGASSRPHASESENASSENVSRASSRRSDSQGPLSGLSSLSRASSNRSSAAEEDVSYPKVTLGSALETNPRRRLEKHEVQQLAYHVASSALGDPIQSPRRFAAAAQTVHDVRTLLKHGRGNVDADTAPSHGQNGIGSSVAEGGTNYEYRSVYAIQMGAGVCNRHAGLTNAIHAPHMEPAETVASIEGMVMLKEIGNDNTISESRAGHCWGELRKDGKRNDKSTIVMDAWANGPAVRLKDSAWNKASNASDNFSMGKEKATFYKNRIEGLLPLVHPAEDEVLAHRFMRAKANPTQWERYAEPQVVSQTFANRARSALSKLPTLQKEQLVQSAAAETYGLSASTAASPRMIHDVLQEANRLDHQERPPIVPGGDI